MNPGSATAADPGTNDLRAYRQRDSERERVADLLSLLPPTATSALDVGARDGHLSMLLADRGLQVTALDLELPQIADPRVRCVKGDATALDFADGAFDVVLCAEVLEHIPTALLGKACEELQRVAGTALLIGVPYRQDIRFGRTTCAGCGRSNPPWGHVNSFDKALLGRLFSSCTVQAETFVGTAEMGTNALAAALMDAAGNPWGTYSQDEPCVHCGASLQRPADHTFGQKLLTRAGDWARRAQAPFHQPHPNWIHQRLVKSTATSPRT